MSSDARRSLRSGKGMITLTPEETELTVCSCFVCNNSISELSGHSFHALSLTSRTFCFIFNYLSRIDHYLSRIDYYLSRIDHDWKIRNRRQRTDIGKFSLVNRTIRLWNRLPAEVFLGTLPCKTRAFRKRVRKVIKVVS